jgi:hypothetical protein
MLLQSTGRNTLYPFFIRLVENTGNIKMGCSHSITREFTKEGITYISDEPIQPCRKHFRRGTKKFNDGWEQTGTFKWHPMSKGKFVGGRVVSPQGWEVHGNVVVDNAGLFATSRHISSAWSSAVIDGKYISAEGKEGNLYVRPFKLLKNVMRDNVLNVVNLYHIGEQGSHRGIFEEDRMHNVVVPLLTFSTLDNKLHMRYNFRSTFIAILLDLERHVENGKIRFVQRQNLDISDQNLIIVAKLVDVLNRSNALKEEEEKREEGEGVQRGRGGGGCKGTL